MSDLMTIQAKIAEANLPLEVDLLIRNTIKNPDLDEHIRVHGQLWYQREP